MPQHTPNNCHSLSFYCIFFSFTNYSITLRQIFRLNLFPFLVGRNICTQGGSDLIVSHISPLTCLHFIISCICISNERRTLKPARLRRQHSAHTKGQRLCVSFGLKCKPSDMLEHLHTSECGRGMARVFCVCVCDGTCSE